MLCCVMENMEKADEKMVSRCVFVSLDDLNKVSLTSC